MNRPFLFLTATLLAGCASAPVPLTARSSPASPQAPEGARLAHTASLRFDDATLKTHTLLAAAQKEQEHWDAYGPVSGTPEAAPKTEDKMDMKHEH